MAGQGFAPKPPDQRRNKHKPRRGEWIELPPVSVPIPKMPAGCRWSARTKAAWSAWWSDPASTQWTEADRSAVIDLAFLHADLVDGRTVATEIRLRMDILGLTQKGKRDLRWHVPGDGEAEAAADATDASVTAIADYRALVNGG